MLNSYPLEPVSVTSFGRRVFVDVIKDLQMRSSWIIQMALKSNDNYLHKREKHREKDYKTEAEAGVMRPQGMSQPPEAARAAENVQRC